MSWWWQQTDEYDPIKAGSIDATDTRPHDHAIIRATQAYYDASRDPKISGDPKATLIFARVAFDTTEETLRAFFSKYGPIKSFRLVRHIVTGASRGYGFVEYEKETDTKAAFFGAQRAVIDGRQIMVDFERCRTMSGWIPRRLGGGLGGRKESGQLRFGGRDRPFRRPIVVNTPEAEWAVQMMNRSKNNEGRSGARSADGWREKDSSNYDRRDSSHRSHHHHHHHHSEERRDERRDRYDRHDHHRDRHDDHDDDRERHRHHHSSHHDKDRSRSRH